MLHVHTDAAVNGNPGLAGVGFVVSGQSIYEQVSLPLEGQWDNHKAEFEAILLAMTWLIDQKLTHHMVFLHSDSQTAVQLIQKGRTKNPDFKAYLDQIYQLENHFSYISLDWVSQRNNRGADHLAKQALQVAVKQAKKK